MNNLHLLEVYNFDKKIRLGQLGDGGYVIGDLDNNNYDCYISAGVGGDESFTRDFIEKYNMNENNSFAFDGTIDNFPSGYTDKIQYFKKNIGSINDDNNTNLSFLTDKFNNIFLKMDIEGGEYQWLMNLDVNQLNKFKQIVIEVHGIMNNAYYTPYMDKLLFLQKLKTYFYLIHAHGNNCCYVFSGIPGVIELTYVNKSYFQPKLNTTPLPIAGLDYRNLDDRPEIDLNLYPFVNTTTN